MQARIAERPYLTLACIIGQSDEMWDRKVSPDDGTATFRYLEISAVGLGTGDYTLEHVPVTDAPSRARMFLRSGDIVVSTTRPHRGAIAEIQPPDEGAIGSTGFVILRGQQASHVHRDFLRNVLLSDPVLTQLLQRSSGGAYPAITPDELNRVLIPTPDDVEQKRLVAMLDTTRERQKKMLADANTLLAGLDGFVLDQLGLKLPSPDGHMVYAARLGNARKRFDPDFHSPRFCTLRQKIEYGKYKPRTIKSLCKFTQSGFAAGGDDQTDDPSIGIPHIRPLNISNTAELHFDGTKMVPRSTVELDDFLQQGEVLFNNTNSTAWVGKTVVFDTDRECVCSNHITRIRLADKDDNPYFLAALLNALRGLGYFGLLATNFNNQVGINGDTLEDIRLPWPDGTVQNNIATEVASRRIKARRLRAEADAIWEKAKAEFEAALLGPGA
jgi:type I restriction enzyme, S subunit